MKQNSFAFGFLMVTLVIYIAGSVSDVSFDVREWDKSTRGVLAFLWMLAAPLFGCIFSIREN